MLSKNQLGFLYMFISICAFSIMDLIVKWSDSYPVGQVLFFRGLCGILFYFFLIPKDRYLNFYKTEKTISSFFKMFFRIDCFSFNFYCFKKFPLATVVSITFAAPIFTTIFSIFFLKENSRYLQMDSSYSWIYWYNYNY